jgi:hypothetical protein
MLVKIDTGYFGLAKLHRSSGQQLGVGGSNFPGLQFVGDQLVEQRQEQKAIAAVHQGNGGRFASSQGSSLRRRAV